MDSPKAYDKIFLVDVIDMLTYIGQQVYRQNFVQLSVPFQKMISAKVIIFGLLFGLFGLSSGLYFHIGETERKCFIEEIPDETMVTGLFLFF